MNLEILFYFFGGGGGLKVFSHFSVLVFGKCLAVRNIFIQVTTIVVFFFFLGCVWFLSFSLSPGTSVGPCTNARAMHAGL